MLRQQLESLTRLREDELAANPNPLGGATVPLVPRAEPRTNYALPTAFYECGREAQCFFAMALWRTFDPKPMVRCQASRDNCMGAMAQAEQLSQQLQAAEARH